MDAIDIWLLQPKHHYRHRSLEQPAFVQVIWTRVDFVVLCFHHHLSLTLYSQQEQVSRESVFLSLAEQLFKTEYKLCL